MDLLRSSRLASVPAVTCNLKGSTSSRPMRLSFSGQLSALCSFWRSFLV
jgi:hypothetical protein